MPLNLMLLVTFLVSSITIGISSVDKCRTPNKESGSCINLKSCSSLLNLITKPTVSKNITSLLQRSHCGFDNNEPKVCCPLSRRLLNHEDQLNKKPHFDDQQTPFIKKIKYLQNYTECGIWTENRIFSGEFTDIYEFTWMALLKYQKPYGIGFHCGGALISHKYVITAAHCVKGHDLPKSWNLTAVRLGEYNLQTDPDCVGVGINISHCSDPVLDIDIEEAIVHENYNSFDRNQPNDIALIKLVKHVDYTNFITPICLPLQETNYHNEVIVAGWGRTESGRNSPVKLKLQVPIIPNQNCSRIYDQVSVQIQRTQLCAGGERGKDSCRGDSGGPLMTPEINTNTNTVNWYLIGIVSFGATPCATENWPGVYTKVFDYIPWILNNIEID